MMMVLYMVIFGTIGLLRKYILLPSGLLSMYRGFIGVLLILLFLLATKKKMNWKEVWNNGLLLLLSGVALGFNWAFLFEAYQYTSVATATLCYYMAPVFVLMVSPFLFKEKMTLRKIICIFTAVAGMVLVSGIFNTKSLGQTDLRGIILGLLAAICYTLIIVFNKKIKNISPYDKTIVQLFIAASIMIPYTCLAEDISNLVISMTSVGLILVLGIVHTGIAYILYFASMKELKTQTIALYSYLDPVTAVIVSTLFLREEIGITGIIGAVMILGAAAFST